MYTHRFTYLCLYIDEIHMYILLQIYVVDSLDRERIGRAKAEFQVIDSDQYNAIKVLG